MASIEQLLQRWGARREDRRHLFIGIGGGSASGKTTIADEIRGRLAPLSVEIIHQDRFFKPARELPTYYSEIYRKPKPDYNHPDSLKTEEMFACCRSVRGSDVVILEGILALYYPELRERMDIKCYVAADADERIIRRIRRNLPRSSYDEITHYYLESVRYQHERYNAPTEQYADLVIPGGMADTAQRQAVLDDLCQTILRFQNDLMSRRERERSDLCSP